MSKSPLGFIPEPITLTLDRILPSRKPPEFPRGLTVDYPLWARIVEGFAGWTKRSVPTQHSA